MPSLFKNIFGLKTQRQKGSFRRMILEDYRWKNSVNNELSSNHSQQQWSRVAKRLQRRCTQLRKGGGERYKPTGRPATVAFGKFGGCIRTIPDVHALWTYLEAPKRRSESSKTPPQPAKEDTGAFELLEHFLSRSTVHLVIEAQDDPLLFGFDSDDSDHGLARAMMSGGDDDDSDDEIERHPLSTWSFKEILASTSSKLEKLSLVIDSWDASEPDPDISVVGRSEVLVGFRELRIISPGKTPGSIRCRDWLWKHARG
ncbi:hypothetical protein BG006_009495, partial [Podila minutissima]